MPGSGSRGFSTAEAVVSFSPYFHQRLGKKLRKLNTVWTAVGLGSIHPRDHGLCYVWPGAFAEELNAVAARPGNGLGDALLAPGQRRVAAAAVGLLHERVYTDGNSARRVAPTLQGDADGGPRQRGSCVVGRGRPCAGLAEAPPALGGGPCLLTPA